MMATCSRSHSSSSSSSSSLYNRSPHPLLHSSLHQNPNPNSKFLHRSPLMEKPYSSFELLSSAAPSFSPIYSSSSSYRIRTHHHHRRLFDDDDEASPRHFLDSCFLCKKPLGVAYGRDIFMYRGDTPFCSEECRQEQIEIDESVEKKSKKNGAKSSAAKSEKINVRSTAGVAAGVVAG